MPCHEPVEQPLKAPCIIIDYRDLYDRLKDIPAVWSQEMEMFSRLWYWKQNDPREG